MTEPTSIFDTDQAQLLHDIAHVREAMAAAPTRLVPSASDAFDRILSVAAVQQANYRAALDCIEKLEAERGYLEREAHRGVRVRHSERLFAEWVTQATDIDLLREGRAQAAADGRELGDEDTYVRDTRQFARETLARLDFRRTTMAEVVSEHVVSSLIGDPDGVARDLAETLQRDEDGHRPGAWGWATPTGLDPVRLGHLAAEVGIGGLLPRCDGDSAGTVASSTQPDAPEPRLFDPAETGPLARVTETTEEASTDGTSK